MAESPKLTAIEQMFSSAVGSVLTSLMVTPFDVVKTRLQMQAFGTSATPNITWVPNVNKVLCPQDLLSSANAHCNGCGIVILRNGLMEHVCLDARVTSRVTSSARFTGTVDAFVKISRQEGVPALWRGLPPTLIMAVPLTVMYFTAYDRLSDQFGRHKKSTPIFAGSIARLISVTIISPIEMLRTKMQARKNSGYTESFRTISNSVRTQGYLSLWRGLGATLLRDIPFSVVYWFGYENLKQQYQLGNWGGTLRTGNQQTIPPQVSFLSGAMSGAVAATLTLPFDVIKTHQQTQLGEALVGARDNAATGLTVFRDIVRDSGYRGLLVGLTPRVLKVAPACAIMISSYEFGKDYFREKHLAEDQGWRAA